MYSVNKRKESQYALCQKYEELYFDSLDIKINDIPPQNSGIQFVHLFRSF